MVCKLYLNKVQLRFRFSQVREHGPVFAELTEHGSKCSPCEFITVITAALLLGPVFLYRVSARTWGATINLPLQSNPTH